MIFLVKGHSAGGGDFARRLAQALNPSPPAWPVDDASLREWQAALAGWDADLGAFRAYDIDVDQAIGWVCFEHLHEYPPPPRFSPTSQREFERWRGACCRDALGKHLARIFELVCELMHSVEHPVLTGSELGTTPKDEVLAQMVLFKHSTTPRLKIQLEGATATVAGRPFPFAELLQKIRRNPDGSIWLDPSVGPVAPLRGAC